MEMMKFFHHCIVRTYRGSYHQPVAPWAARGPIVVMILIDIIYMHHSQVFTLSFICGHIRRPQMNLWGRTVLARLIVSKFYRLKTRFTQPLINKLHQTSPLNQNFLFCKPPDFTQTMQRSLSRGKIAMRGGYFTGVPQVNITNTNNCEQVMALHIPGFSKIMSMCIISHQINNAFSTNPSCLFSLK